MSRGESQSLVQLLHACDDNATLLVKKDQEYAQYIANTPSNELTRSATNHPSRTENVQGQYNEYTSSSSNTTTSTTYNTYTTAEVRGEGGMSGFDQMYASLYTDTGGQTNTTSIAVLTMEEAK